MPDTTVPVDPSSTTLPPALGPLVVIPAGCVTPEPALAVFSGTILAVDDPAHPTTARFQVDRVLAGDLQGYLIAGATDVRYGSEARFLTVGSEYIVGVRPDAGTGVLASAVREEAPLFGGDAVIGANDSDTDCPRVQDPARTIFPDGTSVDTAVLAPLKGHGSELMGALLKPLAIALLVLIVLVLLKHLAFAIGRDLRAGVQAPRPPSPGRAPRAPKPPPGRTPQGRTAQGRTPQGRPPQGRGAARPARG